MAERENPLNTIGPEVVQAISSKDSIRDTAASLRDATRELKALVGSLGVRENDLASRTSEVYVGFGIIDAARTLEIEHEEEGVSILTQDERDLVDSLSALNIQFNAQLNTPTDLEDETSPDLGARIYRNADALTLSDTDNVDIELRQRPHGAIKKIGELGKDAGLILVPDATMNLADEMHTKRIQLAGILSKKIDDKGTTRADQIFQAYVREAGILAKTNEGFDAMRPLEQAMNGYRDELRIDLGRRMGADKIEDLRALKDGAWRSLPVLVPLLAIYFSNELVPLVAQAIGGINLSDFSSPNWLTKVSAGLAVAVALAGVAESAAKAGTDTVQLVKLGSELRAYERSLRERLQTLQSVLNPPQERRGWRFLVKRNG